jgi:hypothetical protein
LVEGGRLQRWLLSPKTMLVKGYGTDSLAIFTVPQ